MSFEVKNIFDQSLKIMESGNYETSRNAKKKEKGQKFLGMEMFFLIAKWKLYNLFLENKVASCLKIIFWGEGSIDRQSTGQRSQLQSQDKINPKTSDTGTSRLIPKSNTKQNSFQLSKVWT